MIRFLRSRVVTTCIPVATLILVGAAVVPAPVSAARPAAASVKALALSASDVTRAYGSGWRLMAGTPITQKTVALSTASKSLLGAGIVQRGFRAGYVAIYSKTKNVTVYKNGKLLIKPGVTAATSGVYSFNDSSTSSLAFKYAKSYASKSVKGMHMRVRGLSGVGDEAVLETTSISMGATLGSLNGVSIFWRHGSYLSILSVEGHGSIGQNGTVSVAKVLDARIGKLG